ncbi:hypothetical protein OG361_39750 [Streptomyces sp. NBC_00090]|uniref:hypothetical protein n=1 Tax=Streptomyces sp. NBC_00090 TaxID=2903619 RepID=UPI00324D875A
MTGPGRVAGSARGTCAVGDAGVAGCTGAAFCTGAAAVVAGGTGAVAGAGLAWGAGAGVTGAGVAGAGVAGAAAGGAEAVVLQSAPGARRERRTGGRRCTGGTGVPAGVVGIPGPVGETGPGTFWGRPAAEGSGAAVSGVTVGVTPTGSVDPFSGVRAGAVARWTGPALGVAVPPDRAAPAGARRRGGCTGRAETSGERRTGAGRTGPRGAAPVVGTAVRGAAPASGAGVPVPVTARGTVGPEGRTGPAADVAERWTVGTDRDESGEAEGEVELVGTRDVSEEPDARTGAAAAPSRTGRGAPAAGRSGAEDT